MLTHVNEKNQPGMVDVGEKLPTRRVARARSVVRLPASAFSLLHDGEIQSKKGPVFQTAIVAGTMAAKKTSDLLPFCHPIPIESCTFSVTLEKENRVLIECEVSVHHRTGVEMEALTGAGVAALTIYDMCKSLSHEIVIEETRLVEKQGGKSDFRSQEPR